MQARAADVSTVLSLLPWRARATKPRVDQPQGQLRRRETRGGAFEDATCRAHSA